MSSIDIYSAIPVAQSKICNKCKESKLLEEFSKMKDTKDGYQRKCKACEKEYRKTNTAAIKNDKKIRYQANKEEIKNLRADYYQENKERDKSRNKEYRKANKGKINARNSKYRAAKSNATPFWAELDLITQLHNRCVFVSEYTCIQHHVDHIVPLISDLVCGLHCIANLRIITAEENLSKSNSYWPDMW